MSVLAVCFYAPLPRFFFFFFLPSTASLCHCVTVSCVAVSLCHCVTVLLCGGADSDCDPECTGDLVCVYRRAAGRKLCKCRRGSTRQSPDSDVCIPNGGSTSTSTSTIPIDIPKPADPVPEPTTGGGGEACNMQCDMNRRLLKLVNDFRAENGKDPLS